MSKKKDDGTKIVADNRKARYAYSIDETLEAGIMLVGSEVKSLRSGKSTISESYAYAKDGELFLVNAYIPEYTQASRFNHEPKRQRKLLVHKREAGKLAAAIQREGMTLIPLKLYFNPKGVAKVELGIAKGKKLHDKRETEKKRDWARDKARLMRDKG
ncbi:MAG: SsrA-binding protein SmpB [Proteobacteria bacterium]|nr:SsrA-binding protein SmpB [Pseudomonadota bacterium]